LAHRENSYSQNAGDWRILFASRCGQHFADFPALVPWRRVAALAIWPERGLPWIFSRANRGAQKLREAGHFDFQHVRKYSRIDNEGQTVDLFNSDTTLAIWLCLNHAETSTKFLLKHGFALTPASPSVSSVRAI
jgi:hypothetical protein